MNKGFTLGDVSVIPNDGTDKNFDIELVPKGITYITESTIKNDIAYQTLLEIACGNNTLIEGPKGSGKTTAIAWLAQETNNPLRTIQITGATGLDSFIGKWLVNENGTYWVDGDLTAAVREGHWLILDELNMALPEIIAVLRSVTDDRKILFLNEKGADEKVLVHPNFRVFACVNPEEDYAGTKEMNAADTDRFSKLITAYPNARKERAIILSNNKVQIDDGIFLKGKGSKRGYISTIVEAGNNLRKAKEANEIVFDCSTRSLIEWAQKCFYQTPNDAMKTAILNKAQSDDRSRVYDIVKTAFADDAPKWIAPADRVAKTKRASKSVSVTEEVEVEANF